jgi:hypothetical protein
MGGASGHLDGSLSLPLAQPGTPIIARHSLRSDRVEEHHRINWIRRPVLDAVGTRVTSRPPQSGRIEARTGLRMMEGASKSWRDQPVQVRPR